MNELELISMIDSLVGDLIELHDDEIENGHHGDDQDDCEYCRHIAEAEAMLSRFCKEK